MIKFSVVIPFYNVESYLEEAIESVLNQSYNNWEIILINDGSEDRSLDIAIKYTELDSRIKLFSHPKNENEGVSASRNLGIRNVCGDWISFLDADDFWKENKLELESQIINKNSDISLIYSKVEFINNKSNKKYFGSGIQGKIEKPFEFYIKGIHIHLSSVSVKRSSLELAEIQFDEEMFFSEDTLFCHEVFTTGPCFFVDEVMSFYRFNASSATNFISNSKKVTGRYIVYEKLLKNKNSKNAKIVSFHLVDVGLEKLFKLAFFNPKINLKLFLKYFPKTLRNKEVYLAHKLYAFLFPFSVLFKYFKKRLNA
jgi:glycosyltransferase involved in cell wall biosynthesis